MSSEGQQAVKVLCGDTEGGRNGREETKEKHGEWIEEGAE